jgi:hypothetical protein
MGALVAETRVGSRWTGMSLVVSGLIQVVGVVALLAMFAGFATGQRGFAYTVGTINDASAIVVYPLAVPGILALRPMLRTALGAAGEALTLVGLVAVAAIAALQLLLVGGVVGFEQQIGPVTIAFLALGAWFVAVGGVGRSRGLPVGVALGIAAGLYVGYPLWAVRLGRHLAAGQRR